MKSTTKSAKPKLRPDGLRAGSAATKLVDALCRKSGATHPELCEAVGWEQSLPYALKSAEGRCPVDEATRGQAGPWEESQEGDG